MAAIIGHGQEGDLGELINFHRHLMHRCRRPGCFVCDARLASCERCGGAECSMPTDCPGERMTSSQADDVCAGLLDYDHRVGWMRKGRGEGAA